MKGIIRIAGLEFKGLSWTYWNLFLVKEIQKRVKKEIGSTGIKSYRNFFKTGQDRYRVDYLIISCTSSSWDRLRKELEWRYVCVDPTFKFNKKKQSWVRTEVDFYKESELKEELLDFPVLINARQGLGKRANFEIRWDNSVSGNLYFYKPYTEFTVDEGENYKDNFRVGILMLSAERKWKRNGGGVTWRKRKAWKLVGGNFQEA